MFLLVFCAFLPGFGTDLKWHWAGSGLLALGGCLLALRLPKPWILPGLLIWFAGLGTTTLLALWHSGLSDGFTLAGLFPYSDAAGYFGDAQRILAGEPITSFSSRRPLYAAFLAGLLKMTGNNLRWTLWLQTLLVSCALGCAIWGLWKRTGRISNTAVFGMTMWLFFRRFVGTTTTENLGFMLGTLGFLALWEAAHDRSVRLFLLGVLLTGLALNARAGAFFVLPALLLWGGLHFAGKDRRISWRVLGLGSGALVLAFGLNYGVLILSGGQPGLAFSNFSYTLYGLVHGGNWQLALAQHPELRALDPGPQAASVFRLALDRIAAHPLALIEGTCRAWAEFLPRVYLFVESPHPWAPTPFVSLLMTLLALRGFYQAWPSRSTAASSLMFTCLAGILLSVPFAPPWDSDFMRIFAATIPVLCWLASMGAQTMTKMEILSPPHSPFMFKGLLLAGTGFLFSLALPHAQRNAHGTAQLRIIPGSMIRVDPGAPRPDAPAPSPARVAKRAINTFFIEGRLVSIPLNQLLENAHPLTSPVGAGTFLKSLPQENLTLVLATGKAWPARRDHDTNLVVLQGSGAWAFDAREPQTLGSISPPPPIP